MHNVNKTLFLAIGFHFLFNNCFELPIIRSMCFSQYAALVSFLVVIALSMTVGGDEQLDKSYYLSLLEVYKGKLFDGSEIIHSYCVVLVKTSANISQIYVTNPH